MESSDYLPSAGTNGSTFSQDLTAMRNQQVSMNDQQPLGAQQFPAIAQQYQQPHHHHAVSELMAMVSSFIVGADDQ